MLPEALFDHYQLARQRLEERRYEEALGHYYAALRLDPRNRNIGFELGVAQEKLGLWLNALLTYHRLFSAEPQRRWRPLLPGRRLRSRAELLARYRYMTLLGFGERLARQWITTGEGPGRNAVMRRSSRGWTTRDMERQDLREQLRELMSERYTTLDNKSLETLGLKPPIEDSGGNESADEELLPEEHRRRFVSRRLRIILAQPRWGERGLVARRNQEAILLLLFHVFAQHEAKQLHRDCRFQSLRRFHTGISATSIRIAQVWATRRLRCVQGAALPVVSDVELFGRRLAARVRRSASYTDHYNTACTLALVTLPLTPASPHLNRKDLERIAQPVVRELRRAVAAAESGVMAGRWDWIVSEDPDLAGLRDTRAFRAFESECFPSARPAPERPTDVHHVELARHSARLFATAARRFELEWHRRAQQVEAEGHVDIHEIQEWWQEEVASWELMERCAVDFRDWQMRLAVIHHMQSFALRRGQKPFQLAHPRYADDSLEVDTGALDEVARRHVDSADRRISRLREFLAENREIADDVGPDLSWRHRLRALDRRGQTLEPNNLRRLCHAREAVWAALATWFEAPVGNTGEVEKAGGDLFAAVDELPLASHEPALLRDLEPARRWAYAEQGPWW